jgi:hypothetical protein
MAYSLKRDPREPDYRRRLPTAQELEAQKPVKIGKDTAPSTLGVRSRNMALLLTVVGLASFMVPLITAVPAVEQHASWSPFQIFMALTGNSLPAAVLLTPAGLHQVHWLILADTALFGALFEYGILAACLISVLGNGSRMVVGWAAALGVFAALIEMRGYQDFQLAIFGGMPPTVGGQHVLGRSWSLLMLAVTALILTVAMVRELDGELPEQL